MSEEISEESLTWERIPTKAFGYMFTHIPDFIRDNLDSLEREGVIYSDHWIEELQDGRHVRISLTSDEAEDYARRTWAYELFIRATVRSGRAMLTGLRVTSHMTPILTL